VGWEFRRENNQRAIGPYFDATVSEGDVPVNEKDCLEVLRRWHAKDPTIVSYIERSANRLSQISKMLPDLDNKSCLDLGSGDGVLAPWYFTRWSPKRVVLTQGDVQRSEHKDFEDPDTGRKHRARLLGFNVESDIFPFSNSEFDVIMCFELLEHLQRDPMHMLLQCNRVLCLGGQLLLTTPNINSISSMWHMLHKKHPGHCSYLAPNCYDRHNREYTIAEVTQLANIAGFDVKRVGTCLSSKNRLKHRLFHTYLRILGVTNQKWNHCGTPLMLEARKIADVTELAPEERYPSPVYSRLHWQWHLEEEKKGKPQQ
jgi:2-polyprenyl-3-methyl-5-hydroxy-6-metoxy-1,4-benzoquinol methylase